VTDSSMSGATPSTSDVIHTCDVVVVGGRVAGAAMALWLSRAGVDVVVVDRDEFPSETLSTHMFQAEGVRALADLGVLDEVLATGAPWLDQVSLRFDDVVTSLGWPLEPDDKGPALCVRREVLDMILMDAVREAGVAVHTGTKVVDVVKEGGRVKGVRAVANGRSLTFKARLVIGADGRLSSVARLVGARKYNETVAERFGYWGYFRNVDWESPATLYMHRWDEETVVGCPCDSGLFLVSVIPPLDRVRTFAADAEANFTAHVGQCEPIRSLIEAPGVERDGDLRHMANPNGFLREATRPGWVLVGDSGHFKDPTPAQGISDALRQARRLSACISEAATEAELDAKLRDWWKWRDKDAFEHHYFAEDAGRAGRIPAVTAQVLRQMNAADGGLSDFLEVMAHRKVPSQMISPVKLARALGTLVARRDPGLRAVAREVRTMTQREMVHRWRLVRPRYADNGRSPARR
jgi:2-polyprenyl-6-methoxyphenol hydroxylase-like FAD-dependent oxidoreductase